MKWWITILCVIKLATVKAIAPTPIVLWHGMGDTCCGSYSLGGFKYFLEKQIPGVYVLSLKIGDSIIEDFENSYFMYTNSQIEYVCKVFAADAKLQNGFNAIGFSQGSQFLRAVVQRCGHKIGRVKNLITLGGQHQGVYGLPHCGALSHKTCDYVRELLNYAAYQSWLQRSLVQATYWHDPLNEDVYKRASQFLSDVNNELSINQTYVDNLNRLDHFVMVLFENDTIAQPKESSWFGFYAPGQSKLLLTLQQSQIYKQDRLGLKKMDLAGKLVFLSSPGDHLQFSEEWFINNIIANYLALK
ncbi:palmitoyl-protein thioesterase 1-like [Plodia interpunctella]|uniref:palmitoyl-protein thioesterase 1-like n=1 Tax=Plodia interpunctella TaxID=58824 RepID=UPI0023687205|nr:palmitoyl-protein thioesterase 1-like [Plodia interpunctella]